MSRPTKGQRRRNKAANRRAIRKRAWESIPEEWREAWEPTPAAYDRGGFLPAGYMQSLYVAYANKINQLIQQDVAGQIDSDYASAMRPVSTGKKLSVTFPMTDVNFDALTGLR